MQLIATLFLAMATSATARSTLLASRQDDVPTQVYQRCGGFVVDPQECPSGYQCIEPDPRRPGVTDLPGICLPESPITCGGFAGGECFSTTFTAQCYDWPNDGCDPNNGGADCIGLCLLPLPA